MVVGEVALACRSGEETAHVVALVGELCESFGKCRRVLVTTTDDVGDGFQPGVGLSVELRADAPVELLLVIDDGEVGMGWAGGSAVGCGDVVDGSPDIDVTTQVRRELRARRQPDGRLIGRLGSDC